MQFLTRSRLPAFLLVLGGINAGVHAADGPKRAVIFVEDPGTFEVLYSRAESSATGAAFFGLIGYGVEESTRSSNDAKREEHILQFIESGDCVAATVRALENRLREKGFESEIRHEQAGRVIDDAYVLRVDVAACGYKMIDTTRDETTSFFAAEYEVLRPGQRRGKNKKELLITGEEQVPWSTFENDAELAQSEFDAVRVKAGRRLANKLIYLKD